MSLFFFFSYFSYVHHSPHPGIEGGIQVFLIFLLNLLKSTTYQTCSTGLSSGNWLNIKLNFPPEEVFCRVLGYYLHDANSI